jgi:hypothetical protein
MRGWLTGGLPPTVDFQGFASLVESTADALVRHGRVPAWNAKWLGGSTEFMGSLYYVGTAPLAWLLGPVEGAKAVTALLKLGGALGVYALFVRFMQSPGAGVVAAYAYACSTFANTCHATSFDVAWQYPLLPPTLIAAAEAVRTRRVCWALALGALLAGQAYSHYAYVPAMLTPVLILLLVALRPWSGGERAAGDTAPSGARWALLGSLGLLAFLLLAGSRVAWLLADGHHHVLHSSQEVAWGTQLFVEQSPLVYLNRNDWLGFWLAHRPPGMLRSAETLLNAGHYLGVVAIAVSVVGWFVVRHDPVLRRWYQLFGLLLLVQHSLSMGPQTLLGQIARTLGWPSPWEARLGAWLTLGALGLVGSAVLLLGRAEAGDVRRARRAELALGLAVVFWFASHSLFAVARDAIPWLGGVRAPGHFIGTVAFPAYCLFGVALAGILRRTPAAARPKAAVAVAAAIVIDFWPGSAIFFRRAPEAPVARMREALGSLPEADVTVRVACPPRSPSAYQTSSLILTGTPLGGACNWLPWRSGPHWPAFRAAASGWIGMPQSAEREAWRGPGEALARVGRLRYFLDEFGGRRRLRLDAPWELRATSGWFALWERPDVLPMAYGHRRWVVIARDDPARGARSVGQAAARNVVALAPEERDWPLPAALLEGATAVVCDTGPTRAARCTELAQRHGEKMLAWDAVEPLLAGTETAPLVPVRYERPAPERMVLVVDAGAEPAVLFVSESHHPWWEARVDGGPARVYRAQLAFMAVPVGPGRHRVEMRLRRPTVVAAADAVATLSWSTLGAGSLLWGLGAVVARRRRASPARPRGPRAPRTG